MRERRGLRLIDEDAGAEFDLGVDGGHGGTRAADAGVGSGVAADGADVVSDAGPCHSHPVAHGCALESTAFRDGVFEGVGVAVGEFTIGVIDFSVFIGVFIDDFFEDFEFALGGRVAAGSGADGVVHDDLFAVHESAALAGEVDVDPGVGGVGFGEEFAVSPDVVGFGVFFFGLEMLVGSGFEGVDVAGFGFVDNGFRLLVGAASEEGSEGESGVFGDSVQIHQVDSRGAR